MKINLIAKRSVEEYVLKNNQSRTSLYNWVRTLKKAEWDTPHDIVNTFGTADLLGKGSNRVIFNIGGNKYRVICAFNFGKRKVRLHIKWIGTHAEYTRLCRSNKQHSVSSY